MTRGAHRTATVRAGIGSDAHHGAVIPPLHLSTTFAFPDLDEKPRYDYSRSGNPTRDHLADALARLEGGAGAAVTSSGMSAVALALQLVNTGDRVVAPHDCYGGTHRLLQALHARGSLRVEHRDLTRLDELEANAFEGVGLVWIETPSNPLLRITDVAALSRRAKEAGALVVVDNTFLSPVLQRPIESGADLVVHSTTKYLNGHSDVVGGAVISASQELAQEIEWWANCTGVSGSPFDSYLTLRGLRTLHPRIRAHEQNTAAVVDVLSQHPAVRHVYYPGLPTHLGHELAARQQDGFGAMVSAELVGGEAEVRRFVHALRHFSLAESLGGVESLVCHPATMTHASMPAEARAVAGIADSLVRFSVGIEDGADLTADLRAALDTTIHTLTLSRPADVGAEAHHV